MFQDSYSRKIDYLRISVTDRCNLRCVYCVPECGILQKAPYEILTFEEIAKVARLAIGIGINKIRITGGEPMARRELPRLIRMLSSQAGLKELSLTTNGMLIEEYATELKEAGLKRLNISIDTLDERKFRKITRSAGLRDVLLGIDAAIQAGFLVKLNVVAMRGMNDDEILGFAQFAREKQIIIRFIELMPMIGDQSLSRNFYISCAEIKDKLKSLGELKPVDTEIIGNGPARYYKIEGFSAVIGFITPLSDKFCLSCNRLRLTSDGILMPCLLSQEGVDLRNALRQNHSEEEILSLIEKAIFSKPAGHNLAFSSSKQYLMSQIGG